MRTEKNNFPSHPRYDYCVEYACSFLESYDIKNYPLDLYSIIEKSPYNLIYYSDIMSNYNISLAHACKVMRSPDGQTVLNDGTFTIFLNDVNTSIGRRLFTLAHEIGHIWLGHLLDFNITAIPHNSNGPNMPRYKYNILEREANVFARNILSPLSIFYKLKNKRHYNIQKLFGLSWDAADMRINFIYHDYRSVKNLKLANRFIKISEIYFNKNKCTACNHGFTFIKPKYCPICGSKNTLEWGDGDMKKYPLLETYETGKLKECPICENSETNIDGDYCQICGSYIVNRCANEECTNTKILPSNARFCPICGCKSIFYDTGLLKAWNHNEISVPQKSYFIIPEGIDEELPFN